MKKGRVVTSRQSRVRAVRHAAAQIDVAAAAQVSARKAQVIAERGQETVRQACPSEARCLICSPEWFEALTQVFYKRLGWHD